MKLNFVFVACMALYLQGTISLNAQSDPQSDPQRAYKIETRNVEEEDGPMMFKFEPNFLFSKERRREEMAQTRRILDTLDISENKRKKLLKDLYKNGLTKRLSKALITDNKFEETEN